MRGEKRGQAAIELLSVYGWALIIVAVAIAAFFFFFGFNKTYVVRQSCDLTPGFTCSDYYIDHSSIILNVKNSMDWDLSSITFSYEECKINSGNPALNSGEKKIFAITGCNFSSSNLFEKDNLFVKYTFTGNPITHNKQFSITTTIEDGDSQNFGAASYVPDEATVLLMKFDDVDGGIANDETTYNNDGILNNFDKAVGLWRFNEGNGVDVLDDSPNSNDGIIGDGACTSEVDSCPIWTAFGVSGPALQFDGIDDYAAILNSESLNPINKLTITAWAKWKNHPTKSGKEAIISKGHLDPYGIIIMEQPEAQIEAYVTTTATKAVNSDYDAYQDEWTHVAFSYDQLTRRMYIDGALVNTNSDNPVGQINSNSEILLIGDTDFPSDQQYHFNGTIDEVAIYNATLTQDELEGQYMAQKAILYRGWAKGKNGGGMQFDGKDDYIDLGDNPDLSFASSNFTIEAWIKLDSSPTTKDYVIFSKYLPTNQYEYKFYVSKTTQKIAFAVSGSGSGLRIVEDDTTMLPLGVGAWYHIAAVKEDNKGRLYVNGKLVGSKTTFPPSVYAGFARAIIGNIDGTGAEFHGIIDDLRVSNYARY